MWVLQNSAVLQTIENCLPKVDGWKTCRIPCFARCRAPRTPGTGTNIQQLGIERQRYTVSSRPSRKLGSVGFTKLRVERHYGALWSRAEKLRRTRRVSPPDPISCQFSLRITSRTADDWDLSAIR